MLEEEKAERERVRSHLIDYCTLDTLAMVRIVEELYRLAGSGRSEGTDESYSDHSKE